MKTVHSNPIQYYGIQSVSDTVLFKQRPVFHFTQALYLSFTVVISDLLLSIPCNQCIASFFFF